MPRTLAKLRQLCNLKEDEISIEDEVKRNRLINTYFTRVLRNLKQRRISRKCDGKALIIELGIFLKGSGDYFLKANVKEHDDMESAFKSYFLSQIDTSTPEKQLYWRNKFPEVFEEQQRLATEQIDLQMRLTKINIFGARNIEDYQLLHAIQNGHVLPLRPPFPVPKKKEEIPFIRLRFSYKTFESKWLRTRERLLTEMHTGDNLFRAIKERPFENTAQWIAAYANK